MNEPSVFHSNGMNGMPVHNVHIDINGNHYQHMYVHNAYGALQQNSTYHALYRRDYGQNRPFVLSRSFFLGSQRYGAIWTGDASSTYESVEASVNMLLTLGVTGIVFGGGDIPGFYGAPFDDLFVQFYQVGMYYPFFRAHNILPGNFEDSNDNYSRREPWLQSERIQLVIKNAVRGRYENIHYLYTQFRHANFHGLPIMRPMWMEFPQDTNTFPLGN